MAELTLTDMDVPPGHGVISKLTPEDGDFPITWDPADPEDVANARAAFDDLRQHGYRVYRIEDRGKGKDKDRTLITAFDPALGAMQLVAFRRNAGG